MNPFCEFAQEMEMDLKLSLENTVLTKPVFTQLIQAFLIVVLFVVFDSQPAPV